MRKDKNGSTGPKSRTGKARSSQNAKIHNLFSRELGGDEAERALRKKLRQRLRRELSPQSLLQELALDEMVTCMCRLRLAQRFEQQQLRVLLEDSSGAKAREDVPVGGGGPVIVGLQSRSPAALRQGLELLDQAVIELQVNRHVAEELRAKLEATFGAQAADAITHWKTPGSDVNLAFMMVRKADKFKWPLPPGSKLSPEDEKAVQILREELQVQAQDKMLDLLRSQIAVRLQELEQNGGLASEQRATNRLDLATRYVTSATRALHAATDRFFALKQQEAHLYALQED